VLSAIARGKAGRVRLPDGSADVSWREVFRQREDLLTAVFFGRLAYLSDTALHHVMEALIGKAAAQLGAWLGIELWPRLARADGLTWVEPDVLLRFERAMVMVEVKPPNGADQTARQWRAELEALRTELQESGASGTFVHFVALGRTARVPAGWDSGLDSNETFAFEAHRVEWDALASSVSEAPADCQRSDAAVFDDWRIAFGLFGVRRYAASWETLASWSAAHLIPEAFDDLQTRIPSLRPAQILAVPTSLDRWRELSTFSLRHPLRIDHDF